MGQQCNCCAQQEALQVKDKLQNLQIIPQILEENQSDSAYRRSALSAFSLQERKQGRTAEKSTFASKTISIAQGDYKYHGSVAGNMRQGYGEQKFKDGFFAGQFKDGARLSGQYKYPNGVIYRGPFNKNSWCKLGTFTFPDGTTLSDLTQISDQRQSGKCVYPDGTSYEGELKNGLRDGRGKYFGKGQTYEGTFSKGQRDGTGLLTVKGKLLKAKYERGRLMNLQ